MVSETQENGIRGADFSSGNERGAQFWNMFIRCARVFVNVAPWLLSTE
jgi:hypothetical protein